ncbi:hypothetical protein V5F44_20210 [Xanthobacter sp. V2C-8]|uniref:hypothetical protein n=1 Tax=Xanthobacter albus TaxID=3119929 RepID=UPI003728946D
MANFDPERDFPAYFESKSITPTCESCGHNEWTPMQGAGAVPALRQMPFMDYRLPTYVLICRNCGLVRLYAKVAVDEWHKATGKP